MPKHNTLKSLGSLFLSSIKCTPATTTSAAAAKTSPAVYKSLTSLDASSASTPKRTLVNSHKRPQPSKPPSPAHLSSLVSISVDTSSCLDSVNSEGGGKPSEDALEVPWYLDVSNYGTSVYRERKEKWRLKKVRVNHVDGLVDSNRLLNQLLKICIENASTTDDETVALEQVSKVFEVFMSMKRQGFPIEEESYGQVLLYLIDRGMVEQFHFFADVIKGGSASTLSRLGYYEKLLYTRVNDGEKVEESCNCQSSSFSSAPQPSQPTAVSTKNPALPFQPHRQMPKHNTPKCLGSLFLSSIKYTPATTTSAAAAKTSPAVYKSLTSLDASSASTLKRTLVNSHKRPQPSKPPSPAHLSSLVSISVDCSDSEGDHGGKPSEDALEVPWFLDVSNYGTSRRQKVSRERKEKWRLKKVRVNHVDGLVDSNRLGNELLKICIENASTTDDETVALEQVSKAFEVFMSMKKQGFPIEEESYGQVLLYLIDRGMVEQFHLFADVIKDGSASTLARLGYYEKLLYTRVNDGEKVQESCNCSFTTDGDETISLRDVVSRAVVDGGDC